ncbi:MAG TPA: hypothetical protein VF092_30595, partial [Longimicrobium sp.]
LERFHVPAYRKIFYEELPAAMEQLLTDRSPETLARASVTYNMIVEGVLAETGYHSYHESLAANGLMPGLCAALVDVKRDESRHIAYGVYLLSRLLAEHGDAVWETIESRLNELLQPALGIVAEVFAAYDVPPFGLRMEEFTDFALSQFSRRVARLEKARTQTVAEVAAGALETEEAA